MGNALFIVWRESAEAMLVVGILYAWLRKRPDAAVGMRYLWGGVAVGAALAIGLALVMLGIASSLSGNELDYFELGMMLVASALIVQMVFWMRRHGRTFKRHLEDSMAENARRANWWGLLIVVALAVGRETAEAVVFLYGLGAEKGGIAHLPIVLVLGIAAAFATFWLLQQGTRFLSWRVFFRVSEILLLLLAGALLVSGVERLIALGVVPDIGDPLWNTTWLLDDSSRLGGLVASFTGYRARPALLPIAALAVYWVSVTFFLNRPQRDATVTAVTAPSVRHVPHS
ncbi:MAG TPA: FTR1 family protein [Casimicrobiaceae bacterium]|jgi:high-affinity iron transporter|nr:FTR1 family protein [Casimicrobiaceae bacterium]